LLTVDFRPSRNHGGSPDWASMVCVDGETFSVATDQNIQNIILELNFYSLMRQKEWYIAKSVVFFHPYHGGPAGRPMRFCAGRRSTANYLCSQLYYQLSVLRVLSGSRRAPRRRPMYFPIRWSLPARPEPDNTFWTDSAYITLLTSAM